MEQRIIVTGGGHGIGKQICADFIQAGTKYALLI